MFVNDLSTEECRAALARSTFGRLACSHDNQPYIVPVHFAVDDGDVYLFSMPGQKIDWMRENPRVCLELDSIHLQSDWTTVVVVGRYEELPDRPEFQGARARALVLLQQRAMWWEPSAVAPDSHPKRREVTPVVYRIRVDHLTGRRAVPGPHEAERDASPSAAIPRP